MKKFVISIGLLAALASPVLAQASSGYERQQLVHAQSAAAPSDVVIVDGKVVGQDPDPGIRQDIRKDNVTNEW
jgi:hypothetical protein